jgi:hypothetical protein
MLCEYLFSKELMVLDIIYFTNVAELLGKGVFLFFQKC